MSRNKSPSVLTTVSHIKPLYPSKTINSKNLAIAAHPSSSSASSSSSNEYPTQNQYLSTKTTAPNTISRPNIDEQSPIKSLPPLQDFNDFMCIPGINGNNSGSGNSSSSGNNSNMLKNHDKLGYSNNNCINSVERQNYRDFQRENNILKEYNHIQPQNHNDFVRETMPGIENQYTKSINSYQDSMQYNTLDSASKMISQGKKGSPRQQQHKEEIGEKIPAIKYSNYIDIVAQLREIIHKLQLKDAIQRQEISKLKKQNENIRTESQILEEKINKLEKARYIDNQYMMKIDSQLLQDKRQKSAKKGSSLISQDRHERTISTSTQDKKIEELTQTVQSLTDKIKVVASEKSKLEDVIKNLLLEKELQRMMSSSSSANLNPNTVNTNANVNHGSNDTSMMNSQNTMNSQGVMTSNGNALSLKFNYANYQTQGDERAHKDIVRDLIDEGNPSQKEDQKGYGNSNGEKRGNEAQYSSNIQKQAMYMSNSGINGGGLNGSGLNGGSMLSGGNGYNEMEKFSRYQNSEKIGNMKSLGSVGVGGNRFNIPEHESMTVSISLKSQQGNFQNSHVKSNVNDSFSMNNYMISPDSSFLNLSSLKDQQMITGSNQYPHQQQQQSHHQQQQQQQHQHQQNSTINDNNIHLGNSFSENISDNNNPSKIPQHQQINNPNTAHSSIQQRATVSFNKDFDVSIANNGFQISPSVMDIQNTSTAFNDHPGGSISDNKTGGSTSKETLTTNERKIIEEIRCSNTALNTSSMSRSINLMSNSSQGRGNTLNESGETIRNPSHTIRGLSISSNNNNNQGLARVSSNSPVMINRLQNQRNFNSHFENREQQMHQQEQQPQQAKSDAPLM